MRVAIVTHAVRHNDGQGRVNHEIASAALAEGCTVTLVATHVAPALLAHPRLRWVPIHVGRVWQTNLIRHQVFAIKSALWLRQHRHEFDVVHVNGFISWVHADVNTAHFVHSGWFASPYYPYGLSGGLNAAYQYLYTCLNARLERWAYRRSSVVAAVSEKVAAELREAGVPAQRIEVIHNGVDVQTFAGARGDRRRFGLPDDAFLLLFAGDLRTPRKNLGTVLSALVHLPENVHVVVAGRLHGSRYPDVARTLRLDHRVHFLDFVEDVPSLMHSVDAYVFPSRYEAMSLSLLEAIAAGLPVVTARTAGGAEVIGPDCGIVLPDPDDPRELAKAIAALADDEWRCRLMGAQASRLARQFEWSRMAARYLDLYRRVARQAAHAASGTGEGNRASDTINDRPAGARLIPTDGGEPK
ncbi:glycosyltransferase family 4 protein [Trinickia fusca]|uniref:Glycosyltransferase family 1 protein n=1 Tax=Trinickia fusca TaxID=2419777 RepID=A0A494XJN1_9BURK|nr:glycosyltransferase family 4 protein [Trinickia fusca]RKP48304.1 glycosyltransferase family 1 protein [Trinickia fusca]